MRSIRGVVHVSHSGVVCGRLFCVFKVHYTDHALIEGMKKVERERGSLCENAVCWVSRLCHEEKVEGFHGKKVEWAK